MKKLSEQITEIFTTDENEVTLRTLMSTIDERSFGVLISIFALPSALPVPAPGYSTFFSIFLILLSVQMLLNRSHPWFPKRFMNTKIGSGTENKTVATMLKFLQFFENFSRPRFTFLYSMRISSIMLSAVMLLCAVSMISPLPLTNTLPALAIFLIGLGKVQDDGVLALLGLITAVAGLGLSITLHAALIFGGQAALDQLLVFLGQ